MRFKAPPGRRLKCSDIPDERVLLHARAWRSRPIYPGVVAALIRDGVPEKLARTKVEKLVRRGLLEYGWSHDYAWPVDDPPKGALTMALISSKAVGA